MEKSFEKHPAYQEEDLEIKTPEELEKAKKAAGVTSREEARRRLADKDFGKEITRIQRKLEELNLRPGDDFVRIHTKNKILEGLFTEFSKNIRKVGSSINEIEWVEVPHVGICLESGERSFDIPLGSIINIEKIEKKWHT